MEATLAVLRHGLQNDGKAVESKSPEDEVQQSATNRKPLQPLSNVNQVCTHVELLCLYLFACPYHLPCMAPSNRLTFTLSHMILTPNFTSCNI